MAVEQGFCQRPAPVAAAGTGPRPLVPLSPCPQGSAPPLGWTGWLLMAPSSRGSSPGLFVAGPGRGWLWAWVIVSRPVPFLLRGSEVGDWAVGGAWVPSSDLGLGLS